MNSKLAFNLVPSFWLLLCVLQSWLCFLFFFIIIYYYYIIKAVIGFQKKKKKKKGCHKYLSKSSLVCRWPETAWPLGRRPRLDARTHSYLSCHGLICPSRRSCLSLWTKARGAVVLQCCWSESTSDWEWKPRSCAMIRQPQTWLVWRMATSQVDRTCWENSLGCTIEE